jgi:CheY-like chemotaxis protein
MPSEVKSGLQAGFFRYVSKPIRVREFLKTLDEALLYSQPSPSAVHHLPNDNKEHT